MWCVHNDKYKGFIVFCRDNAKVNTHCYLRIKTGKIMTDSIVCFGEMLWDILPEKEVPGGAVMNVAYHLKRLGEHVALVSKIGNDKRGRLLTDMLSVMGIDISLIQTDPLHETGRVFADMSNPRDVRYDIVFPSAWDFIEWTPALEARVKRSDSRYVVFGSLCSRHEVTKRTLTELLKADLTKVLDVNLREPHYTQAHIEWLLQECHVLKLNNQELELITAWHTRYTDMETAVKELSARFRIPVIVVTKGADGALLWMNNTFYNEPGIPVQVVDTIGSGDAFLAGFLHSLIQQQPAAACLAFANRLGALVAGREGGAPVYDAAEIAG